MEELLGESFDYDQGSFLQGLGDFHLRSAITLPKLESLQKGKGRKREVRSISKVKDSQLYNVDPGRLLSLLVAASVFEQEKDLEVPYLDELIELMELEHTSMLGKGSETDDIWSNCLRTLKEGEISSMYSRGRLILQLLVVYSMILSSGRVWEKGDEMFDYKLGVPRVKLFGIQFFILGEFVAMPYHPDLQWGNVPQNRREHVMNDIKQHKIKSISSSNTQLLILSLDVVRMLSDKFTERENVDLATLIGSKNVPVEYPPQEVLERLFGLLDKGLWEFGNDFYQFIKTYEALVTGVILDRNKSDFSSKDSFLQNTKKGLDQVFLPYADELEDLLWDQKLTIHHLSQLFGMFRMWGHPVVDSVKGLEKVFKIGGASKVLDSEMPKIAGRKMKEVFFTNYRAKEKEYPKFSLKSTEPCYLTDQLISNDPINLKSVGYSLTDWDNVQVEKTFEIPKTYNLSMIIADKAVSADRDEIHAAGGDPTKILSPEVRRGVIKWIKQGMVDCKTLLHGVNQCPTGLPKKCRIIGLYPKEREINPVARMFSLMSLMMRAYIVITEDMLSSDILPYIPGVTMTYDLLDLTKAMVQATRDMLYQGSNYRTFSINIDFEKWNLNFRKESTYEVFDTLGRLYGLPKLYNRTYDIFRNSVIYLSDGTYLPKFDDNLDLVDDGTGLSKMGHLAGLEGLRQKGWTIFTAVVIAHVCDSLGIDYKLMGQGDNQVLVAKVYSSKAKFLGLYHPSCVEEINSKLETLLSDLRSEFLKLGLPIKPLETWTSDQFFSYGKIPIYRGLPCSLSLKKLSRVFAFSNEDLMTTDNALGAIIANSQAAAMASLSFVVPYIIQKWQSLLCVGQFSSYHPLVGSAPTKFSEPGFMRQRGTKTRPEAIYIGKKTSARLFRMLAVMIPKEFGGFNSCNAYHMIMRGFPDKASLDACWMYQIVQSGKVSEVVQGVHNFLRVVFDHVTDYSYLVQDPEALNLLVPQANKTLMKNLVREQLLNLRTNSPASSHFFEVLKYTDRGLVSRLCEKITLTDALNVRFLHDIMGSTLFGYCDALSSKVDKTVTLSRMTSFKSNIVGILAGGECTQWEYFKWRITYKKGRRVQELCPTEYVRNIRNEGWGKRILGVTTPFPAHFLTYSKAQARPEVAENFFYSVIDEYTLRDPHYTFLTLGRSMPYLGSVVKEKLNQSEVTVAYGTEPLVSRPTRLLRAIGWFISENSLWADLLEKLVKAVSDIDPKTLITVPEEVKGSMEHRYQDFSTSHGTFWGTLYGPCTHVNMSTNNWSHYQGDGKNYTLQYQAALCYIQHITINNATSPTGNKMHKFYDCCPDCVKEVTTEFPELPEEILESEIPSCKGNPYLFINKEDVNLRITKIFADLSSSTQVGLTNFLNHKEDLYWYMVEKLADKVEYSKGGRHKIEEDPMDMNSRFKSCFKKVLPKDLFLKVLTNYWVRYHNTEAVGRRTPSWRRDKRFIMRNIASQPPSNFSSLGGFFFWETGIDLIRRERWFVPPLSYPATPLTISMSCKASLLRLCELTERLTVPISMIVDVTIERALVVKKNQLCFTRSGGPRFSCSSCCIIAFSSEIKKNTDIYDLLQVKCDLGHSIYFPAMEKISLFTLLSLDQISDYLATPIKPNCEGSKEIIEITRGMNELSPPIKLITNNKRVADFTYEEVFVPNMLFDFPDWTSRAITPLQIPTRSFCRVLEVLLSIRINLANKHCLVLGDGFGWSSLAVKMLEPKSEVKSWDLIDTSASPPHILHQILPPMHYNFPWAVIDSKLSFSAVSDIFSELWEDEVTKLAKQVGEFELVLSEIELCHGTGRHPDKDYSDVLSRLSKIPSVYLLMKVVTPNFRILVKILEAASGQFTNWAILSGMESPIKNGISWLLCYGNKKKEENCKFGSVTIERIYGDIFSEIGRTAYDDPDYWSKWETYYAQLGDYLYRPPFSCLVDNMLSDWYSQCGMLSWKDSSMSTLLNELRHYKVPQSLKDVEGSDKKYYFQEDHDRIRIRLIALAGSFLSCPTTLSRFTSYQIKMKWSNKGRPGMLDDDFYYNPVLTVSKDLAIQEERRELLRYATLTKMVRKPLLNKIVFDEYSDSIVFRYINRKNLKPSPSDNSMRSQVVLSFPISKNSSYRVSTR